MNRSTIHELDMNSLAYEALESELLRVFDTRGSSDLKNQWTVEEGRAKRTEVPLASEDLEVTREVG